MRAALALSALAIVSSFDLTHLTAQRAALRITDDICHHFRREGVVVLRGMAEQVPHPLERQGCPFAVEEYASVHSECRLAASLACTLLRADAVRDPIGDWGKGWTHAHDHYSYASVITERESTVVVILPREPVTLTLRGYPAAIVEPTRFSSTSYPPSFEVGADDGLRMVAAEPPPEPEINLEAGDALVLRGDRTEPPGGLGGGSLVYHFAACDADHRSSLFRNPVRAAREALLKRGLGLGGED